MATPDEPFFTPIIPPAVQAKMNRRGITLEHVQHVLSTAAIFRRETTTGRIKYLARFRGKPHMLVIEPHGDGSYTIVSIHARTPRRPNRR